MLPSRYSKARGHWHNYLTVSRNKFLTQKRTNMQSTDRGIGSEGLEQGGPNLGNDYSRKDLSTGNAGDALTTPNTIGLNNDENDTDELEMDNEPSRNLGAASSISGDTDDFAEEVEDEDLDDDDLDDAD